MVDSEPEQLNMRSPFMSTLRAVMAVTVPEAWYGAWNAWKSTPMTVSA